MKPEECSVESCMEGDGLQRVVDLLRGGGVLAYPAETMYGLGGDGLNPGTETRIARIKGRDPTKPIILLLDTIDRWRQVASRFPEPALRLAKDAWPGPLTLLLPAREDCPAAREGKVAVRVPGVKHVRVWVRSLDRPISSTSANRSGENPLGDPAAIRETIGDAIDLLVSGSVFDEPGPPSTLVDGTCDPPLVIRAGAFDIPSNGG